jgi:hypothetical protein
MSPLPTKNIYYSVFECSLVKLEAVPFTFGTASQQLLPIPTSPLSGDTPANVRERTLLIAIHQFACPDEWLSNRMITNTCPLTSLLKIKIMPIFRLLTEQIDFLVKKSVHTGGSRPAPTKDEVVGFRGTCSRRFHCPECYMDYGRIY